jgi:hypothetical protein
VSILPISIRCAGDVIAVEWGGLHRMSDSDLNPFEEMRNGAAALFGEPSAIAAEIIVRSRGGGGRPLTESDGRIHHDRTPDECGPR